MKHFTYALAYSMAYFSIQALIGPSEHPAIWMGALIAASAMAVSAHNLYRRSLRIEGYGDLISGLVCFVGTLMFGLILGLPLLGGVYLYCRSRTKKGDIDVTAEVEHPIEFQNVVAPVKPASVAEVEPRLQPLVIAPITDVDQNPHLAVSEIQFKKAKHRLN